MSEAPRTPPPPPRSPRSGRTTIAGPRRGGSPSRQRAFLRLARPTGLMDGTALIDVPDDYIKDEVETRVGHHVTQARPRARHGPSTSR